MTTRHTGNYGNYVHHYDNDEDSDSEFSSSESEGIFSMSGKFPKFRLVYAWLIFPTLLKSLFFTLTIRNLAQIVQLKFSK